MNDNRRNDTAQEQELFLYWGECYVDDEGQLRYTNSDIAVSEEMIREGECLCLGRGETRRLTLVSRDESGALYVYPFDKVSIECDGPWVYVLDNEISGWQHTVDDVPLIVAVAEQPELRLTVKVSVVEAEQLFILPYNYSVTPDGSDIVVEGKFIFEDLENLPWSSGRYLGEHDWLNAVALFPDDHLGLIDSDFLLYRSDDEECVTVDESGFLQLRDFTEAETMVHVSMVGNHRLRDRVAVEVLDVVDVALVPKEYYPSSQGKLCRCDTNEPVENVEELLESLSLSVGIPTELTPLYILSDGSFHYADGFLKIVPSEGITVEGYTVTLWNRQANMALHLNYGADISVSRVQNVSVI